MREIPPFLVISGLAGIFQVVQHTEAAGKLNSRGGTTDGLSFWGGRKGVKCLEKQDKMFCFDFFFYEINAFLIFPAIDFIYTSEM